MPCHQRGHRRQSDALAQADGRSGEQGSCQRSRRDGSSRKRRGRRRRKRRRTSGGRSEERRRRELGQGEEGDPEAEDPAPAEPVGRGAADELRGRVAEQEGGLDEA